MRKNYKTEGSWPEEMLLLGDWLGQWKHHLFSLVGWVLFCFVLLFVCLVSCFVDFFLVKLSLPQYINFCIFFFSSSPIPWGGVTKQPCGIYQFNPVEPAGFNCNTQIYLWGKKKKFFLFWVKFPIHNKGVKKKTTKHVPSWWDCTSTTVKRHHMKEATEEE